MNTIGVRGCRVLAWLVLTGMMSVMVGCAQTGAARSLPDSGTAAESIAARYHEGSIQSVETADQALEEVRGAREKMAPNFSAEERTCYDRFFTNLCLDDVEERKRSAMQQLRRVEVEANAFKRRDKVERRDTGKALREKRILPFPGDGDPPSVQPLQEVRP
jgi:acyl-coenzyme A synthetase/AMP-(fatty) acid ligase